MPRPPKLEHVKYVRRGARWYAYFNTGRKADGKIVYAPLPDPMTAQFHVQYGRLREARKRSARAEYTVSVLIDEYLASSGFADKAKATQDMYRLQLGKAKILLGKEPADSITPTAVRIIMDGEGWSGASCNVFRAALSAAYSWARKYGKATAEPTRGIERRPTGEYDPWPHDILEAGLAAEDARIRLAVHILYYTGLRITDACNLRWDQVKGGIVRVTPQKTKRHRIELEFPAAAELRAVLDATPKLGLTILAGPDGKPTESRYLREQLQAFTAALGVKTVPHGLRKNAVNSLLESGCTVPEVSAITGQSHGMVEHYAAKVNRRKMGNAAIHRLDKARAKG